MTYTFKLPQLPKGFQVKPDFQKSVEAAFEKAGIPVETAQTVFGEVLGHFAVAHERETAEAEAIARQNSEFNTGMLRDRWGDKYDAKCAAALDFLDFSGLSDAALEGIAAQIGAPNMIEQLARAGERIAAARAQQSSQPRQHKQSNQPGETKVEDPAQLVRTLERQLTELRINPEFLERFTDERHQMHQYAVQERQALIDRLAAAQALVAGRTAPGLPGRVEGLRAELKRQNTDPEFVRVLNDQRDHRHADYVKQRQSLMREIASAEAPAGKTSRSTAEVRRDIEAMRRDEGFAGALTTAAVRRTPQQEAEYRGALDRHQTLVKEFGVAERQEAAAATHTAAAGTDHEGA